MRKLKPIPEIVNLTPNQREQLHAWFERGITFKDAMADFQSSFGVPIKYHKIRRYYHCWLHAKELHAHTAGAASHLEILSALHGEAAPYADLTHHFIQKAACVMAARPDNATTDLYRLMRIANNPATQELARERVHLQSQKLAFEKHKHTVSLPPPPPKPLTPEENQERIWNIFGLSEEERVRRRAANRVQAEREAAAARGASQSVMITPGSAARSESQPRCD
jgi:hypothetical protein